MFNISNMKQIKLITICGAVALFGSSALAQHGHGGGHHGGHHGGGHGIGLDIHLGAGSLFRRAPVQRVWNPLMDEVTEAERESNTMRAVYERWSGDHSDRRKGDRNAHIYLTNGTLKDEIQFLDEAFEKLRGEVSRRGTLTPRARDLIDDIVDHGIRVDRMIAAVPNRDRFWDEVADRWAELRDHIDSVADLARVPGIRNAPRPYGASARRPPYPSVVN